MKPESTIRVPLYDQPRGYRDIDPKATQGAVLGENVFNPDGSLVTIAQFAGPALPPGSFPSTTDGLPEGSLNLYYTNARADARVAAGIAAHVAAPDPHTQYALDTDLAAEAALRVSGDAATLAAALAAIAAVPPSFMPTLIAAGDTFTVPANKQGLFAVTIDVQGTLDVVGTLAGV